MYHEHMSVKFQMTLPEDLAHQLRQAAARERVPLAQYIRDTMAEKLRRGRPSESKDDPFAGIRDLVDSPESDLSSRVDEVLYGGDPHQ